MNGESDGQMEAYFKPKPYENPYHKDARQTLFTSEDSKNKKGGLNFCRDNCYTKTDYVLMKHKVMGYSYTEQHIKNINELQKNTHYYEVICSGKFIKLAFDIDGNEGVKYTDIITFCELFKQFITSEMETENPITYAVLISVEPTAVLDFTTPYKSYHIVFNIYTKRNDYNKQIVNAFLEQYTDHIPFKEDQAKIDKTIYSAMKLFRAVGQSKEDKVIKDEDGIVIETKKRTDILRAVDLLNECFTDDAISGDTPQTPTTSGIGSDLFITWINKETDYYYDYQEPQNTAKVYDDYQIQYVIPHYEDIIALWIEGLTETDFMTEWIEALHYLLHILKIGALDTSPMTSDILKLFLEKSRVGHYADMTDQNIEFIKNILDTNKHKRLNDKNPIFETIRIRELCDYEIKEIYRQQSKLPSDKIYLILQSSRDCRTNSQINSFEVKWEQGETRGETKLDTKNFILSINQTEETEHYDLLYDTNTRTLLINAFVFKKRGTSVKVIQEYNIVINTLLNYTQEQLHFCNDKHIEITDWNDKRLLGLNKKGDLHIIIEAPTSSGKTYNQMRNRLSAVLKNPNRRVCVITDTRSLTSATDAMIKKVFTDNNIPLSFYKNYLSYNKDYNKGEEEDINEVNNENTKLLLVCVDSLSKYTQRFISGASKKEDNLVFTDLIIDEYQNITNGIIKQTATDLIQIRRQKEVMNAFIEAIKTTPSVSIYDADIKAHDIKQLKTYTGKTFNYVKYMSFKQKVNKIKLVMCDDMYEEMKRNYLQAKPQTCALSVKDKGNNLYDEYVKLGMNSNLPILLITSEGASDSRLNEQTDKQKRDLKAKLCANTELWKEYMLVFYSSTITTGISFNTADDQEPYFYRHYSVLTPSADKTPTSTARGQMDRRVRQTQTAEMFVAIEGDNWKTLCIKKSTDYDLYFKNAYQELQTLILKRTLYGNEPKENVDLQKEECDKKNNKKKQEPQIIITEEIADLQKGILTLQKHKREAQKQEQRTYLTNLINKDKTILETHLKEHNLFMELNALRKANIRKDNCEFIGRYMRLLVKWGVEEITTDLYRKINQTEQETIEKKEKDRHIYTKEQATFEAFNTEHRITHIKDTLNQDENMKKLRMCGYGQYHAKLYGLCEPYFNQVAFSVIGEHYKTQDALYAYGKLFDYEFYDLLRKTILKNILVKMEEAKKELNRTDRSLKTDMKYIVCACIMFELFKGGHITRADKNEPYDYKDFMRDMIITRSGEAVIINTDALMSGLINDLKPISRYLFKSGDLNVKNVPSFEAITAQHYIITAFDYFNTIVAFYEDKPNYITFKAVKNIPFRLQEINYDIQAKEGADPLFITDGDIDDYKTMSECPPYITYSGLKVPLDYMPKVKRQIHKTNDRLYKLIEYYVVEANRKYLQDAVVEHTHTLKKSFTKISYDEAKELQDEFDELMKNGTHFTLEKCGIALGGEITEPKGKPLSNPLTNEGGDPPLFKPARRFEGWKVSNEGVVYDEKDIPQKIINIPNSRVSFKERSIDYDFTDEERGDKTISYVIYRNRMFKLNIIVAEAFCIDYDSENSYVVALDDDYTNNNLTNIKVLNTKEEFIEYMKTLKQAKNTEKKTKTADKRKAQKNEQKNEKRECVICGASYAVKNKSAHEKTEKHKKALPK